MKAEILKTIKQNNYENKNSNKPYPSNIYLRANGRPGEKQQEEGSSNRENY